MDPQKRQHQRGGGVVGDHNQIGGVRGDEAFHHLHHALDEVRLFPGAVGETGVVGAIDVIRPRPQLDDFGENREPAEA